MALRCLLLAGTALIAIAAATETAKLIRKEEKRPSRQAFIEAGGVLVKTSKHVHDEHPQKSESTPPSAVNNLLRGQEKETYLAGSGEQDLCDENYLYGAAGQNLCGDANETLREEMCTYAAQVLFGANARGNPPNYPFSIGTTWQDYRPRGCFRMDGEDRLFYNPFGAWPSNVSSTSRPVCHRPKYRLGTHDTNDGGTFCAAADDYDYTRLVDETACRTFAECTGHCAPEEFRVGIAATTPGTDERPANSGAEWYDKRPKGCFINADDGCVYFNVPQTNDDGTAKEPAGTITGIPVCHIPQHGGDTANYVAVAQSYGSHGAGSVGFNHTGDVTPAPTPAPAS